MMEHINTTKSTDEIIFQFNEAFRLHDATILNDLVAEDCIMEAAMPAPNGIKTVGKKDCLIFWQQMIDQKDTQFTPEEVIVMGEKAVILWRYNWAEGIANSVRGVTIVTVKGGLITEALGYVKAALTN
jgi:ketosteroid isomerase-like protein